MVKKINLKILFFFVFLLSTFSIISGCYNIQKFEKDSQYYSTTIPLDTLNTIVKNNITPTILSPMNNGKFFSDYIIIGNEKEDNTIKVYIWIYAQEYYVNNNNLESGVGGEFPVIITISDENANYLFVKYDISRKDDSDESIKLFPSHIRDRALEKETEFIKNRNIKREKEAKKYYNLDN